MTMTMKTIFFLYLVGLYSTSRSVSCFTLATTSVTRSTKAISTSPSAVLSAATTEETSTVPASVTTKDVVQKVAVAGATGRTGQLVVQELLNRGVQVVGMVRSMDKAKEVFPDDGADDESESTKSLTLMQVDLTSEKEMKKALVGCDATIWCATGFSDAKTGIIERFKRLLGIALAPKQSIDFVGIPSIAKIMLEKESDSDSTVGTSPYPKVIMLSSAGVTRPKWDDDKKEKFSGCADIPIVRLNPFGILDVKAESEEKLREIGVNYCIVRPAGLNDNWPIGSRPIISQGDVAVGRINRHDVAKVLVDVLSMKDACEKTFEMVTVAGYVAPNDLSSVIGRLKTDKESLVPEEVSASYSIMQQLLPGEQQDAAALAMGQTYEQLDSGTTGRLGERGQEDAEAAAPKPTNV